MSDSCHVPISSEWDEYHLTPRGWIVGTSRRDSGTHRVEPPADRILTVRTGEDMDRHGFTSYDDEVWPPSHERDENLIAALKRKFGARPHEQPPPKPRRKGVRTPKRA